jgi:FAD/FMN-containing dehydrogenase
VNWARTFSSAMQRWAAGRVYMNILGQDESDRIREAYGDNYARLARVKATFDPSNVFKVNHNIAPATCLRMRRDQQIDTEK